MNMIEINYKSIHLQKISFLLLNSRIWKKCMAKSHTCNSSIKNKKNKKKYKACFYKSMLLSIPTP